MKSGKQLDQMAQLALDNPRMAADVLGAAIQGKIDTADKYQAGIMTGRGIGGIALSPIGIAAGIGDVLTSVENHGAHIDTMLDYTLYGGSND